MNKVMYATALGAALALNMVLATNPVQAHTSCVDDPGPGCGIVRHQPLIPLNAGNRWSYVNRDFTVSIDVLVTEHIDANGLHADRVENFLFPVGTEDVLFYKDRCGRTCELNPRFVAGPARPSPQESLGDRWYPCRDGCTCGTAMQLPTIGSSPLHGIKAKLHAIGRPITVPAGTFPWSVTVDYDWQPSTTQVAADVFVPGVGLVQRTVSTPGGRTEVYSLYLAIIGPNAVGDPNFALYPPGCQAAVQMTTWGAVKAAFIN